jgi:hypothetical protein
VRLASETSSAVIAHHPVLTLLKPLVVRSLLLEESLSAQRSLVSYFCGFLLLVSCFLRPFVQPPLPESAYTSIKLSSASPALIKRLPKVFVYNSVHLFPFHPPLVLSFILLLAFRILFGSSAQTRVCELLIAQRASLRSCALFPFL